MRPRLSSLLFGLLFLSVLQVYSQDPTFEWVVSAGSAATFSGGYGLAHDAAGNTYVAGRFTGTIDFDPGPGTANLTSAGALDIFVTKTDVAGNLVWAKRMGGTLDDYSFDVFVNQDGSIYVTGAFVGTADFDPGAGTFNLSSAGLFEDIFVLKLDADGNFAWARKMGSADFDFGRSITVSSAGNVFTTGSFRGTVDFDPGAGTSFLTSASGNDIFISKLDASGNFVWARRMGGTSNDIGYAIAVDAAENVFTTGSFNSTADFDPGPSAFNLVAAGSGDIFVSKLNPSGDFVWATRMGGTSSDVGYGIQVDFAGNVYTTGYFESTADFDPGAGTANLVSLGFNDSFVSKLDAVGNYLWAKGMGGISDEESQGIALDGFGNVYITGSFESTVDFDPGPGTFNITPVGSADGFILKLSALGDFVWAQALAGTGSAWPTGIAVDYFGSVCTTGYFGGTVDFDPGLAVSNATAVGSNDLYIHKMSQDLPPPTVTGFAPPSGPVGTTVVISGTNFAPSSSFNTVYFGAAKATVTAATATQLTVTVPIGATYDLLRVTVSGFTSSSTAPFLVTFLDGGTIDACSFSALTGFGAVDFGYGIATGDLDLDGKVDILISKSDVAGVQVFRNTSTTGTLDAATFAPPFTLAVGTTPAHVAVADVDSDGKLDLLATGFDDNIVSIFRNIATPGSLSAASFESRVDLATVTRPLDVEAADLDGDGKTDIVVATEGRVSFWRNIGASGSLSTASFEARQDILINSWSLAVSDLDVDGKPDLILGPALSSVAHVLRNISTPGTLVPGSFAAGVNFTVGAWPDYIITGDLDNDQRPEILTSSWPSGSFSILKNTSSPGTIDATSFAPHVQFSGLTEPRGTAITDFDGDGKPDIAIGLQIAGRVNVYKNISTAGIITPASFAPYVDFVAGGNMRLLKAADFDGDGKPDIAATNWSGSPLTVIRNQVSATPNITEVTPTSGVMGSQVIITGINFSPIPTDNTVKFNGTTATVIASTASTITAIVPFNSSTGTLTVTRGCNTAGGGDFTVLPYTPPCGSVQLNGVGDRISFADEPSLEPAALTVEAWVKVNAFTSTKSGGNASSQFILFKRNQLTVFSEGYDFVLDETSKQFMGVVSSGAGGGASQRILSTSLNFVNLNQWYHLALTADNVEVKFYVDGVLIGTLPTGFALNYGPEGLSIGNASPLNSWQGAFNGSLDEVRIWNVVRSASQLQSTMAGTLSGNEPGLVAYYAMEQVGQGAGITVTNSAIATGATNNGVTVGSATTPVFAGFCSCVPTAQRDALIALYNATDGANWTDNTGWLSADESTWVGITVTGCDITEISLPGNNLIGEIPYVLGDLPELKILELSSNQLSGYIPPEIGNLSSLILLNLSLNQLQGQVPYELTYLTNLETLGLAFNQLIGNLPVEMEFLTQLTEVNLSHNSFTGDLPLIGGPGPNLRDLLVEFNRFSGLPDLTLYTNLNAVDIGSNHLTFDDIEPVMTMTSYSFNYSPQALVPPGGFVSFIAGNTLFIPFSTGGTANSYQWYKDNVLLPGATATDLTIPSATASDVGNYEVRITNSNVPLLTLTSKSYTVITDPCASIGPTTGGLDTGFAPLISDPTTNFIGLGVQSTGKIIASTSYTIENSIVRSGTLRFNSDGTLDSSFPVNPYDGIVLVQPDNKVVIGYSDGAYAYPVRLNADGTEDATFNSNATQYYSGNVSAMGYQPSDGSILVAANAYMTPYFVERLNSDGTSDGTLPDANDRYVTTIAVQSDGYILLGGEFPGGIVRLDPSGILDPSFIGEASDFVTDIVLQPDGKILVTGLFQYFNDIPHPGIVRLNSDGTIDNTFSAIGITDFIDLGHYPTRLALLPGNKIAMAGIFETVNGADRKNLVVLNSDGTVDCTFDPGTSTDDKITGLAIQTDGRIVIAGAFTSYDGINRYGLARINAATSASCVPASDRAALIALYNSTNGSSWTINSNWLTPDESLWYGVTVSSCRVTGVDLENNSLNGTLPPELGDLTGLVTLRLPNNALSGPLPSTLGNLTNLVTLDLYNAQLSGSVPVTLFGLSNLQTLNLSNNQLTGSLDPQIGNLSGLVTLSFSINQLTGSIPTEIGNLTNLQYLRLALNQFTGTLPLTLGNLVQMKEFSVSSNQLSGTVPATLTNWTTLTVLGLSFNMFTGDLPAGIGGLASLQQVSVRSNQFTSLPAFTSTAITELLTENNRFHFGHLEPNAGKTGFTYSPQSNLAGGSGNACEGTTLTLAFSTPGTANQYQWYKDGVLITGATTATFIKNNAALADAGSYVVHVTNTLVPGLTLLSDPFSVTIDAAPSAPGATGGLSCTATSFTLTATGGSPGEYRWYNVPTGGTDLGTGNDTFITPVITATTTYHVALFNGTCESVRTPVTATIDVVTKPSVATSNCTASGATLSGPAGFASYAWSNGGTSQAITVTAAGTYTLVVTSSGGCTSPVSDPVTFTAAFCNQPPVLQPTTVTTTVQGTATINLTSLTSDLDNNVDLTTLQIITQPSSGAVAAINASFELVVDYTDVDFVGTDQVTLQVCDVAGACVQEVITIEVAGDITVFNALSPNGDGLNDVFFIQYIDALPETQQNKVTIFNRWGTVVFETTNYDNSNNVFRGLSNSGAELPSGTYYYTIEFTSGAEKRTGFISLRR